MKIIILIVVHFSRVINTNVNRMINMNMKIGIAFQEFILQYHSY